MDIRSLISAFCTAGREHVNWDWLHSVGFSCACFEFEVVAVMNLEPRASLLYESITISGFQCMLKGMRSSEISLINMSLYFPDTLFSNITYNSSLRALHIVFSCRKRLPRISAISSYYLLAEKGPAQNAFTIIEICKKHLLSACFFFPIVVFSVSLMIFKLICFFLLFPLN